MALGLGALIGLMGASTASNTASGVISAVGDYHVNKALMEQEMEFNSNEAAKQRDFESDMALTQYNRNRYLQDQQFQNQMSLDNAARDWQSNANRIAMEHSSAEARAQREWETEMSNTAHQREMADLKAAGLNPILAASYSGASVPNGASGSGFANSASGSSASSASVGLPSASSASHNGAHSRTNIKPFDAITAFVGNYMSNAKKATELANKYDDDDDFYNSAVKASFKDLK